MLSYRFRGLRLSENGDGFHGPIEMENNMNYTYLLECSDGTFYCGWTNDLEKRVKAHNSGRGAKYTKPRRPVRLVWYETFETKEEAMSREVKVKRLSRKQKDELVAYGPVEKPIS